MKNRKISIIVIYKNDENTIKTCIDSIINQKYGDYELICINNGSTDNSETIVSECAKEEERINLIKLPKEEDEDTAISTAINLAEGEYICFISPKKVIYESFPGGIKLELFNLVNKGIKAEEGKIYKKELLENTDLIDRLIELKLNKYTEILKEEAEKNKKYIKEELDKIAKNNIETIENRLYDLVNRIKQAESTIYDKEAEIKRLIENACNDLIIARDSVKDAIYLDIHNAYEYISREIKQKSEEISKVYDEISHNYKYTEKLIEDTKKDLYEILYKDKSEIFLKLENMEKESDIKYSSLKRVMDASISQSYMNQK